MKALAWVGLAAPILYFSACSYLSVGTSSAYKSIKLGDSEDAVINLLGKPSVIERPDTIFSRYASTPCEEPCRKRLWFENRLSFDTQAWSVELDENAQVIKKSRWTSP